MMPLGAAAPRFTIDGGGGAVAVTITVAVPEIVPLVALTVLLNVPATAPAVNRPVLAPMVPPPFTTDQTGVIAMTLPFPSRPTAVNCWVALTRTVAGFGVTVMVASDEALTDTITVAVPEIVPLVALTVLVNVPVTAPAVNTPVLASMLPPPFTTDQTGVMATTLPLASLPTAVNCWVAFGSTETGFGVTVMVARDAADDVTVTVAKPETAPLVALTVLVNVPATVPAVNRPVVALMLPPPISTAQTGVIATTLPLASLPTAVNCCVALGSRETGFGVTTMVASGPAVTVTVAVAVMPPLLA